MNMINTNTSQLENSYLRLVDSSNYDQKRMDQNNENQLLPDRDDLQTFFFVLFGYCDGLIACRSFAEKTCNIDNNRTSKTLPPRNIWIKTDDMMAINGYEFAKLANSAQTGCYVIPGTVEASGQAKSSDIVQMQTFLIDIDDGNTEEKLQLLSKTIGEPTLIVESGGITDCGSKKLHIYWQLEKAVQGEELQQLLHLRHKIALYAGGDLHFKSAHQPIRVAGSIYYKGKNAKLVKIRVYNPIEYALAELTESVEALSAQATQVASNAPNNNYFNGSSALPVKQILTSKIYEGGNGEQTRFNHLRKVIGYWIRRHYDDLISKEQAIDEITSYNIANVSPSWPDDKLGQMINGIWNTHLEKYQHCLSESKDEGNNTENTINSITPTCWKDLPPERKWLIENWLPRGCVTALYGDGGVGKSLLMQQLMTVLAIGESFLDIKLKSSRIYAVMCEDDYDEIWRRQSSINSHYRINMQDLSNVRIVSRVGQDNLLMNFDNNNNIRYTEFYNNLLRDIANHKPDLVILDTAADMFSGNENNRLHVRQFIQNACGHIARITDSAVLLCAHPSESGMQRGNGSCGSTAWNNTVRSRWYLKYSDNATKDQNTEHNNKRVLSRVKSNYSASGKEKYLRWQDGVFIWMGQNQAKDTKITNDKIKSTQSSQAINKKQEERIKLIITLLEQQALKRKFYLMKQFADKFQNYQKLGGRRLIYDDCSVAAAEGIIKFFNNPAHYGIQTHINPASIGFGYMCTENMQVESNNRDNKEKVKILPTHFKDKITGKKQVIENVVEE